MVSLGFMDLHSLGLHPKANISYLARENCPKRHLLGEGRVSSLCVHMCHGWYMCGFKGSNSGCQLVPLPAEPFCWALRGIL